MAELVSGVSISVFDESFIAPVKSWYCILD